MAGPYFAYGSNMDPAQLGERCPGAVLVGSAVLPDHRFFITRAGWASLGAQPGASVYGVVWQLTDADIAALDDYEDVPDGVYRRETRRVKLLAGVESLETLVYVAAEATPGVPQPGYLEAVVAAARRYRLPDPYVSELVGWLPGPAAGKGSRP